MINAAQLRAQLEIDLGTALSLDQHAQAARIQQQILELQDNAGPAVAGDGKEEDEAENLRRVQAIAREEEMAEEARLAAREGSASEEERLTRELLALEAQFENDEKNQQEAASLALIAELQAQEQELLNAAQNMFRVVNGRVQVEDHRPICKDVALCRGFLEDKAFQALLKTPAVKGEPIKKDKKGNAIYTNAHKFTCSYIRGGLLTLLKFDNALKLSDPNIPVKMVLKEVLEFVETMPEKDRPNVANIKKSLVLIPGDKYVEAKETRAHVAGLLSRVWSLSKLYGNVEKGLIALILHLNIADKGQCMAGLVARLYAPFALMLNDILSRSVEAGLYAEMDPAAAVAVGPGAVAAGDAGPGAAARREEGEWQAYDPAQFAAPRPAPVAGPGAAPAARPPVAAAAVRPPVAAAPVAAPAAPVAAPAPAAAPGPAAIPAPAPAARPPAAAAKPKPKPRRGF